MTMKKAEQFPIRTYTKLESDSMNGLLSALGSLDADESACIQVLLRPVDDDWQDSIRKIIRKSEKKHGSHFHFSLNPLTWISKFIDIIVNDPEEKTKQNPEEKDDEDPIDEEGLMKEKVKKT